MIRALILPLLWCCLGIGIAVWTIPAWGQDMPEAWIHGNGTATGVILTMVPDAPHVAVVEAHNASFPSGTQGIFTVLVVDGFEVGVDFHFTLDHPSEKPDILFVSPPPGYYAMPPRVEVEEGKWAEVLIFPELLG